MHVLTLAIALAAAALIMAEDGSAWGQWTQSEISGFARRAPRPPRASSETAKYRTVSASCSRSHYDYEVSFPRSIDGGGPVDRAVAEQAQVFINQARENTGAFMRYSRACDEDTPDSSLGSFFKVTSSPYIVSSEATSVLFTVRTNMGATRGSTGFSSTNLLSNGTEITVRRLFPNPDSSLPRLWGSLYSGFCKNHSTTPAFYFFLPCAMDRTPAPPPPDPLKNPDATLDALGHAVLTSLGLSVHLGDYETYTETQEIDFLDIPKADLLEMGADPGIWE